MLKLWDKCALPPDMVESVKKDFVKCTETFPEGVADFSLVIPSDDKWVCSAYSDGLYMYIYIISKHKPNFPFSEFEKFIEDKKNERGLSFHYEDNIDERRGRSEARGKYEPYGRS